MCPEEGLYRCGGLSLRYATLKKYKSAPFGAITPMGLLEAALGAHRGVGCAIDRCALGAVAATPITNKPSFSVERSDRSRSFLCGGTWMFRDSDTSERGKGFCHTFFALPTVPDVATQGHSPSRCFWSCENVKTLAYGGSSS
jgi:hypothetical protein